MRARRRRAVRRDVHDRGVARHRRRGHGEPPLRHPGGRTCAPSPPRSRTEYRLIVDRGLLLQIDAPDLAMERHTLFADRPLGEFLDWVELVVDAINAALDGIDPGRRAAPRLLGQLRGAAHPRRGPGRHPAAALRGERRRPRGVDGQRPPRPRVPVLRAPAAARRHGAGGRRDRHDEQLRRASRGRGRPARAGRRGGRRPAPRHRRHRLRVRHLRRARRRRAVTRVGEAARPARRRRPGRRPACSGDGRWPGALSAAPMCHFRSPSERCGHIEGKGASLALALALALPLAASRPEPVRSISWGRSP